MRIPDYGDEEGDGRISSLPEIKLNDVLPYFIKFSYEAALIRGCPNSLDNPALTPDQYAEYFKQTKRLSALTIEEFEGLQHKLEHTIIQPYSKAGRTLKAFLKGVVTELNLGDYRVDPLIGQFALYPGKSNNPFRVHFIVGSRGLMYVVAMDPGHSLRPEAPKLAIPTG